MFGLSQADYQFISSKLLALQKRGVSIWCFGSRARGDHHEFSDLDLMLESSEDLGREIGELREVFEESRLAIKIDLLQEKDFAQAYRESYLRDRENFFRVY